MVESGPVRAADGKPVVEGVTYFDHPANPGFPSKWHVRSDGWMGASPCRDGDLVIRRNEPLVVRYLLVPYRSSDGLPATSHYPEKPFIPHHSDTGSANYV